MPEGANPILGRKIKRAREEKGFTQFDLALATKSSRGLINRIERGKKACSGEMLTDIRKLLGTEKGFII